VELFERQAESAPEAIAVIFEEERLNYRELNERANQLAHHLRGLGVGPETLVALFMERSVEMIVGIIGVLKSGGAYVPLDPTYPADRLAFMLEDSNAPVILTQRRLAGALPQGRRHVLCLDTEWKTIASVSVENPINRALSDSPAYLIYTSGSTGRPKGVLLTHQNLIHSTQARFAYYPEQITSFLLLPSFAFDSSVAGIFWTLCKGGALIIPRDGSQHELRHLTKLIARHRVSHLLGLPSLYALLLSQSSADELSSLSVVIVAGEACPNGLVRRHRETLSQTVLYNEYGPTEGSVWSTVYQCCLEPVESQAPIGKPIANMQAFILDRSGWPVMPGIAGELYIGGAGLSRGYLKRPELTAEKFIPNPFGTEAGARLYRTGDLARHLPGGEIEFLGRIDHQVKIRGYRIELGEIEAILSEHAAVQEVVVAAQDDFAGEKRLIAYVVAKQERTVNAGQLRAFLIERVPGYMAPSAFVLMEELPLTPSGKVDRRALSLSANGASQTHSRLELGNPYTAPRSEIEQILAGIWQRLLGVERVGIHDNFFELGGHSLLAIQLVTRIRDALLVDLTMRGLFESPTISELGIHILQQQADRADAETLAQMLAELDELSEGENAMTPLNNDYSDR
jgi:amino acid adenylation domain-containing protein